MRKANIKELYLSCLMVSSMVFSPFSYAANAYLEITLNVNNADRTKAAGIYKKYKKPFLDTVPGATSKELLIRKDDVQVLHGFSTSEKAEAYLKSNLFNKDVVESLSPYLQAKPEIRIYTTM